MRALLLLSIIMLLGASTRVVAQPQALPAGFSRVAGRHVDVITDLPLSDELRELPKVFDAAMPQWCQAFGMQLEEVADWHAEAFIMLERERFRAAGFIPAHLPNFPYGFQFENQMWVAEQPSSYYRRHLLLHEGTHWFMNRKYGQHGPPWLMEGMAEWLGTHRWDGGQLTMGVIPKTKFDVPYWGRISRIQQQLADGEAPSLETILRYGDTAHQQVEAYAWSWAAVVFLRNHPHTSQAFQAMLSQPMRADNTLTRWLFAQLREQWTKLRQDWNAFLTELEYGYDPSRGMLHMSENTAELAAQGVTLELRADRSWQSMGIAVSGPLKIQVIASGSYSVGQQPAPWICEPQGVTLEYYRGKPLGQLMLAVAAPLVEEPSCSQPLDIVSIGRGGDIELRQAGELFFRINESSGGLADNQGTLTVEISP